jgi:localization factor PodJL
VRHRRKPYQSYEDDDPDSIGETLAAVNDRLDELSHQVARLARRGQAGSRPYRSEEHELPAGIGRALAQFNRRLDRIAADIARHGDARRDARGHSGWAETDSGADDSGTSASLSGTPAAPLAPVETGQDLSSLEAQLRKITEQISALNRPCRIDDAVFALRSDLADISRAFSDAVPRQALEVLEKEVRALAGSIERSREAGVDGKKLALLEQDIAEMREALRKFDPTESVLAIGRAVQELARKIDQMTAANQNPAALQKLDQEIAGLRDALRSRDPVESLREIGHAVQELTRKMDQIAAVQNPAALQKLDQDIAALRDTLRNLDSSGHLGEIINAIKGLARKIDQIATTGPNPLALQKLDQVIAGLRGIVGHMASNETLAKLVSEVRNLTARFEQVTATDALRIVGTPSGRSPDIETLARSIGQQLEPQLARQFEAGGSRQAESLIRQLLDELEQRHVADSPVQAAAADLVAEVRALAEKLDRMRAPQGDQVAAAGIEDRIVTLAAKLDASAAWLERLDAIERGMADLLVYLDELRRNAAQGQKPEAAAASPGDASPGHQSTHESSREPGRRSGEDPAQDIRVRHTQALGNPLDNPSLSEAVRTLEPVGGAQDQTAASATVPVSRAAPTMQAGGQTLLAPTSTAIESVGMEAFSDSPIEQSSQATALRGRARTPINPELPPDTPLEPTLEPAHPYDNRAAEPTDASDATLNAGKPVAREVASQFETLIAARRAALAASAEAAAAGTGGRRLPSGSMSGSMRSGTSRLRNGLRWMLLVASVIVIVLGAVKVGVEMWGGQERPAAPSQDTAPTSETPEAGSNLLPVPAPNAGAAPASAPGDVQDRPPAPAPAMPMPMPSPMPLPGDLAPSTPPSGTPANPSGDGSTSPDPLDSSSSSKPVPDVTGALSPGRPESRSEAARVFVELPVTIGGSMLRAAAASGNPAAEYEIALRYAEGRGVTPNIEESARWLERAARSGFAPAQFRLGSLYDKGGGLKRDRALARKYYTAAAEQGHAKAMHNLAVLYAEGIDGRPNYRQAAYWFRRAAEHGIADSQYNLAILYIRGIGVEQNLIEAYKWFALAANQGDQEAARKRDEVAERLDAQSLSLAQQKVRGFVVLPQPEQALSLRVPRGGWDRADVNGQPPRAQQRPVPPETPSPPASLLSPHPL